MASGILGSIPESRLISDIDNMAGKVAAKEALQRAFHLQLRPEVPIVGLVTRLAYQKGLDVLAAAIQGIMQMDVQMVVLGTGEVWAHFFYGDLPSRYPGKIGAYIGYDDVRATLDHCGKRFPSRSLTV